LSSEIVEKAHEQWFVSERQIKEKACLEEEHTKGKSRVSTHAREKPRDSQTEAQERESPVGSTGAEAWGKRPASSIHRWMNETCIESKGGHPTRDSPTSSSIKEEEDPTGLAMAGTRGTVDPHGPLEALQQEALRANFKVITPPTESEGWGEMRPTIRKSRRPRAPGSDYLSSSDRSSSPDGVWEPPAPIWGTTEEALEGEKCPWGDSPLEKAKERAVPENPWAARFPHPLGLDWDLTLEDFRGFIAPGDQE
jgi:hypothetical protein